jgi:hypothetical protein
MPMFTIRKVTMSFVALASVTLLAAAPASGQAPVPAAHPYGLDPYSPSDAMWLRNFGAALVAQTPLLELATLDPYKPSDAELIRQLGGAIPLCCPDWYWPGPTFGPLMPLSRPSITTSSAMRFRAPRDVDFIAATPPPPPATSAATTADLPVVPSAQPTPMSVATLARPQGNDGVSIRYAGQSWTSAGRAIPLQGSTFERVGEYAGFPVYKQARVTDDVIYVQTRDNLIAPFRLKP